MGSTKHDLTVAVQADPQDMHLDKSLGTNSMPFCWFRYDEKDHVHNGTSNSLEGEPRR